MRLTAKVLGNVHVVADGEPVDLGGARQRRLLARLLVHRGAVVSTDSLVEAVFDGELSEAAWRTFRTYVARLRRAFDAAGVEGTSIIVTSPPGYQVSTHLELDAADFEDGLADAREHLRIGDANHALDAAEQALAIWAGPAYGEFASQDWARPEAVRLEELRLIAHEVHAEAMVESGRHDEAIAGINALVAAEPLREAPRRLLMLGLYRSGRHAEALRAGERYKSLLAEETGLEWSSSMAALERMIIDRDPRLDAAPQGRELRGYVLGEPISESDLGVTYRASQPSVGRDVTVTVIPAERADDLEFIERFEVHAQRIASIEHPHVVPLYDYWREPGGAYLVTRHFTGGTLEARLSRGERFSEDEAGRIIGEIGAGLHAAHDRGVAHGCLDARAVRFDADGRAHLAGFSFDAGPEDRRLDIEALGRLIDLIWNRTTVATPAESTGASAAVATVVKRATGGSRIGFATPADAVEAFVSARRSTEPAGGHSDRDDGFVQIEGPNPYRGLRAFREADAEVFFGRSSAIESIADHHRRAGVGVGVGPSGTGKSSVVSAGLLPRLRVDGAVVATMVPGRHPVDELGLALSRVSLDAPELGDGDATPGKVCRLIEQGVPQGGRLVLVVDQLEEVLTASDPDERDVFVDAIIRAVGELSDRLSLIASARADFLGRLLEHPVLGPLVRDHSRLLAPMTTDDLYDCIVAPAAVAGVSVEPELAAALVADAVDAPGSLPLLQFTLTELYEHRVDGTLTLASYRRMGGLAAQIAQRADEVYEQLTADDREAARRLFTRLVTPGEGVEDTRRRIDVTEFGHVPSVVLDTFGAARLLTFDRDSRTREPTVEIAHEALIRQWPRLRAWIDDDRAGQRVLRHLTQSALAWESNDRDASELYRGSRLTAAEEWAVDHGDDLTDRERAFLEASGTARAAEIERDRRRRRRLRGLAAGLAAVAVLAVIAGGVALSQRNQAEANAREAEERTIEADEQRELAEASARTADEQRELAEASARTADEQRALAEASARAAEDRAVEAEMHRLIGDSRAVMDEDPDLPLLLGLEAYERATTLGIEPPGALVATLHSAVQSSRMLWRGAEKFGVTRLSGDGRTLVAVSGEGDETVVVDARTGDERFRFTSGEHAAVGAGRVVAVAPDDPSRLIVVDELTGAERGQLDVGDVVVGLDVDPSGQRLLVWTRGTGPGPRALVVGTEAWDTDGVLSSPDPIWASHFSPDGRFLAAQTVPPHIGDVPDVLLWDLDAPPREPVRVARAGIGGWSPDGSTAVLRDDQVNVLFVDPTSGAEVAPRISLGFEPDVFAIDSHPVSGRILVIRATGEPQWYEPDGSEAGVLGLPDELSQHADGRFTPDGSAVVLFGSNDEVMVVPLDGREPMLLRGNRGSDVTVQLDRDATRLLATGTTESVLWDLTPEGPEALGNVPVDGPVERIGFSADGTMMLGEVSDAGVRIRRFDPESAEAIDASDPVRGDVVFSEAGVVAHNQDGPVSVVRLDGEPITEIDGCEGPLAIDDRARWLLVGWSCDGGGSRLVDAVTGATLVELEDWAFLSSFGPSGTMSEGLVAFQTVDPVTDEIDIEMRRMPSGELVGSLADSDERHLWWPLFSADGEHLAIASGISGAWAIDVRQVLEGATMEDAVVANPSGDGGASRMPEVAGDLMIADQGSGEVLRFWELSTGAEWMTLETDYHDGRPWMRATPDGRYLYYADTRVVRRLPLDHTELAALARERVQRDFFAEECLRFDIVDCPAA